ncbi:hypothetical protein F5148DRAFT_566722 [Russula earlei]|uniref:Uncharacterized protein n=1 Tax=Russula earlei TaxID=71964 RepID=A0ACC0UFP8_9AGAM|nr:hypothetical protein F5148DRAFT_566722 [Russula earlei]
MSHGQCQASLDPDADIGGPGVMTSFVIVSWLTIFTNLSLAILDLAGWIRSNRRRTSTRIAGQDGLRSHDVEGGPQRLLRFSSKGPAAPAEPRDLAISTLPTLRTHIFTSENICHFRDFLCDLQLVTGLGILVSGWTQFHSIGYYHQQLVKRQELNQQT